MFTVHFPSRNPQVTGAGGKGTFSGALTPGLLGLRHGRELCDCTAPLL